jgi:phosphonate transport system substrate-binding protein
MSDLPQSGPDSNVPPNGGSRAGAWARGILFLGLIAAILWAGNAAMRTMQARDSERATEESTVRSVGLITPTPKVLATQFTDSQGKLLADAPGADKLEDPNPLVVAHIEGDSEAPGIGWKEFEKDLAKATGKQVMDKKFDNSADQLAQIAKGGIQILALHAADTPFLVNNYGFEPAAVLADQSGVNGNHLDIIVPANSPLNSAADLKGHSLVCTVPASITGYRAAVALLMQNEQMRPNVDYFVTWSLGQSRSISGVAKGEYEAAAVSNDKLQSMIEAGKINKSQVKIIFQSDVIPRTTIGWFYNLKPDLADKVKATILAYAGATTEPSAEMDAADSEGSSGSSQLHFVAIDYRKDFQLVRWIDDSFDPRFDAMVKQHQGNAAQ